MKQSVIFFLLIFLCTTIHCSAQNYHKQFDHLKIEDGLSDATVGSILQDANGFMWFGTFKGLNRFDGYQIKKYVYDKGSNKGPNDNMISSLIQDKEGFIWVGYNNKGVSCFDPTLETFQHYQPNESTTSLISNGTVNCLFEDTEQNLWIGTEDGVSVVQKDRTSSIKYINNGQGINGSSVYDIVEDKWNRIWLATNNRKLSMYNKNTKEFSEIEYTDLALEALEDNEKKNLWIFNDTLLYVCSNGGGLAEYNLLSGKYNTFIEENNGPSSNNIRDIIQVDNKLWLANDGAGLDIFDVNTKTFENISNSKVDPQSISSNVIWSLYKDKQENVWLGCYLQGVDKYDPRKNFFSQITNDPCSSSSIPNKPVLSIYNDSQKNLWVGSDWGGLHKMIQDHQFEHYDIDGKVTNKDVYDVVKCIDEDKFGNLIVGTYSEGLRIYQKGNRDYKHIKRNIKDKGLPSNHIWSILTDSKGITWLGTLGGGIGQYDPVSKECKTLELEYITAAQHLVYHIYEDSKSNIWFSTDGGVVIYERDKDQWNYELLKPLIKENHNISYVKSVYEDKLKHMWMATASGLVKYLPESKEFKTLDETDGIAQLPLLNIISDNLGNLIIISKQYISKLRLSDEKIVSFHIPNNSFNYNSAAKNEKGEILVGGTEGITLCNPIFLEENSQRPPVFITGFDIFNEPQLPNDSTSVLSKSVIETKTITLDYWQSVFNFKYCAINFTETDRNQYAYQLEGFDKNWNFVGDRRLASYTNLDPGKYTFKVMASNNHGIWNKEGASIDVIIKGPFWYSNWFRLFAILICLLLFYLLHRVRMMNVKKKFALERIQADREQIKIQNNTLEKELDETKSELTNITISHLHKNQSLQQIKAKLEQMSVNFGSTEKRKIKNLVREIDKESENHSYWDEFEHEFNKSHNNFLERFKHEYPDLSKRELRICAYLRMDLDNQEIGTLMNISIRTVETARYRIRKKIGLEQRKSLSKMINRF
ncbi:two-component regulator propeller domain-containing protein [Flammeovirga pacifica]|uniref:two-component regulator propeller domain-containing protein n=1 Tax=Flammeovirga pacifica TaxID=915059 RepID=UPI000B1BE112|nr:two-component regulator propeller domain-containing protein [Flammeovirga pacifica]